MVIALQNNMKKTLITFGIVVGIIATPILGMSIMPTRSLILGMASDEQILTLADEIDKSRVENEHKITELQSVIDNQQTELAGYQEKITLQNSKIENIKKETQEKFNNDDNCRKLYFENTECSRPEFRNKSEFNKMIESYMIEKTDWKAYRDKKLVVFEKCQEIIDQCN
jgi:hypothetical protein